MMDQSRRAFLKRAAALGIARAHAPAHPIEQLHVSNHDHIGLVRALAARDCATAVEISHQHVDRLHRTMFVGLLEAHRERDASEPV